MRILFTVLLCLTLAACINADYQDSFTVGEREEDDFIVSNRTIWKPPIPWKAMRAIVGVTAPENTTLTHVQITNEGGKQTLFTLRDLNETNVVIIVMGKIGEGLFCRVECYAKNISTTPAPTSTSEGSEENNSENDNTPNAGNGNNNSGKDGDGGNSAPDAGDGNTNNSGEGGDGGNSAPDAGNGGNNSGEGGDGGNSAPDAENGDNNLSVERGDAP